MPPGTPMPPPDAPGEPPIQPPGVLPEDMPKEPDPFEAPFKVTDSKNKRSQNADKSRRRTAFQSPETIAHKRTSETAVRLLAGLAVQLAIRARSPERQGQTIRKAEQGYMTRLWDNYTKRALRV